MAREILMDVKSLMGSDDLHGMLDRMTQMLRLYRYNGRLAWWCEAHVRGEYGPGWEMVGGDTPPGTYKCGDVVLTTPADPPHIWASFGPAYVYLEELEGQESRYDRSGIGLHGGGSALQNPLSPRQGWLVTHGCIRMQNEDLMKFVRLLKRSRVWITVSE